MMTVDEIVEYFGSKAKAASALGIGRANLTIWEKRGHIPEKQTMRLDRLTGGKLKYNPDDYAS